MKKRGRPAKYTDASRVCIHATGQSVLKLHSDRRAIVDYLVGRGGCATLKEVDEFFGFSMRDKVLALMRAGWLEVS